jgi:hypothetical protein
MRLDRKKSYACPFELANCVVCCAVPADMQPACQVQFISRAVCFAVGAGMRWCPRRSSGCTSAHRNAIQRSVFLMLLCCGRRYAVVPTPLSRLRFFRLVMDEAQQVQGSTAKAAEMARKIQARHRWAVTGGQQVPQVVTNLMGIVDV